MVEPRPLSPAVVGGLTVGDPDAAVAEPDAAVAVAIAVPEGGTVSVELESPMAAVPLSPADAANKEALCFL